MRANVLLVLVLTGVSILSPSRLQSAPAAVKEYLPVERDLARVRAA